ncbi:hypothetical protein QOT17_009854 [Balamuthia mandrillaris]
METRLPPTFGDSRRLWGYKIVGSIPSEYLPLLLIGQLGNSCRASLFRCTVPSIPRPQRRWVFSSAGKGRVHVDFWTLDNEAQGVSGADAAAASAYNDDNNLFAEIGLEVTNPQVTASIDGSDGAALALFWFKVPSSQQQNNNCPVCPVGFMEDELYGSFILALPGLHRAAFALYG